MSFGVLSQTLSTSPTIRWILPAKIRSQVHNDVIFVGDNFIQLREFHDNCQLADVTAKLDLGSKVLDAKVISLESEIIPVEEQILLQRQDEEHFIIDDKPIDDTLPPQLIVLSLMTGNILYLYARQLFRGDIRFVYAKRMLLTDVPLPGRYGQQIAVDPKSRALAISSPGGYICISALKRADDIKREIDAAVSGDSAEFKPTKEERFFHTNGAVLKMDFLKSPDSDPDRVILLVIVSKRSVCSMVLYRWDVNQSLNSTKPMRCSGQTLPPEDAVPLMLIPSSRCSSFIIVTEADLAIYDNITSPQVRRIMVPLPKDAPGQHAKAAEPLLWVQWVKPKRTRRHLEKNENIYIIRSDGALRHLIINHKSQLRVDAHFSLGSLGVNVDTAFATLPGPFERGGDILIAGGDMSSGAVFHLPARVQPYRTQILENWSPMRDILHINSRDHSSSKSLQPTPSSGQLFACAGIGPEESFVDEIRFGTGAQIAFRIHFPDAKSSTQIWPLPHPNEDLVLLLISHHTYTTVLAFQTKDDSLETLEVTDSPGLDFEAPTIAAASVLEGALLQITPHNITVATLPPDSIVQFIPSGNDTFVAAHFSGILKAFAVAAKTPDAFELQLGTPESDASKSLSVRFSKEAYRINSEPTVVYLGRLAHSALLLVGTADGDLGIFAANTDMGPKLLFRVVLSDLGNTGKDVCVGSLVLLARHAANTGIILVGTRDGHLMVLNIALGAGSAKGLHVSLQETVTLGTTAVRIVEELFDFEENAALIFCGTEAYRLRLCGTGNRCDFDICSLWHTDLDNQQFSPDIINTGCRIPVLEAGSMRNLSGLILCAVGEEILVSSVTRQDQAIPRRTQIAGSPQKLAFSRYLGKIVVAFQYRMGGAEGGQAESRAEMVNKPALQLVSPRYDATADEPSHPPSPILFGDNNDRISCILHWTPSDGTKHYDMIVVGLDSAASAGGDRHGKVVCINTKYLSPGADITTKAKVTTRYPGKAVHALSAYGKCHLLTAAGNDIILQSLDPSSKKWATLSKLTLPSAATSLTTQGSLIFAATSGHSLIVIQETGDSLHMQESDLRVRNCSDAVAVPGIGRIVATTDRNGTTILGFSEQRLQKDQRLHFEANLPHSVNRLQLITMPSGRFYRHTFYGSTLIGAICRFTVLQNHETQLLRFMEDLSMSRPTQKTQDLEMETSSHTSSEWDIISSGSASEHDYMQATAPEPKDMHVRGDVLASLLKTGEGGLEDLLTQRVKREDEEPGHAEASSRLATFNLLAEPVVGNVEDRVVAVSRWLRRLLRLPL